MNAPNRAADGLAGAANAPGPRHGVRIAGLVLGPTLCIAALLSPAPALGREAHLLAAVFAWTVVYWVSEAIPLPATALLSSVLAIALGVAPASAVLASYGDPIVFLFIGSFMLAEAFRVSGLDRRFAYSLLRYRWATRGPAAPLLALGLATWVISLWVSNTATTAMMLPVGMGVLRALLGTGQPDCAADAPGSESEPLRTNRGLGVGMMLMLTWCSSVAVGVPVGSPPNLIAIAMVRDLTPARISFFDWVAVTMPLAVLMLGLCFVIVYLRYVRPAGGQLAFSSAELTAHVADERRRLGRWSRAELNVFWVFMAVVTLWVLPGAAAMLTSPEAALPRFFEAHLPESVIAVLGAVVLFVLPTDLRRGEFTLAWKHARRIDWGTVLLFGGGLALGKLMFTTGLAEWLGQVLVGVGGTQSVWTLTAAGIIVGVVLSEVSSNTAASSAIIPTLIAVAVANGLSPVPPAIGAALGASFGFMLPVSTPPNAIVYSSGLVPMRDMIRSGLWLDLGGATVTWLGLRILCPLLGVV
jgi:sodium-dependent dicarboxylate transporter 2/3/5